MEETLTCPKCGAARAPQDLECFACGIIYARYNPDRVRPPAPPSSDQGASLYDPYRPPAAELSSPDAQEFSELATRGSRLAARFVDGLLYMAPVVPLFVVMPSSNSVEAVGDEVVLGLSILLLLGLAVIFFVNLYHLSKTGQTLGKKAMAIRIVRYNGQQASLGRIFFLRMLTPGLLGAIPFVDGLFSLVDALAIFGEERRCIHDHIADTSVIKATP